MDWYLGTSLTNSSMSDVDLWQNFSSASLAELVVLRFRQTMHDGRTSIVAAAQMGINLPSQVTSSS